MFVFTLKDVVGVVAIVIFVLVAAIIGVKELLYLLKLKLQVKKIKRDIDSNITDSKRCRVCNKVIEVDEMLCDHCTNRLIEGYYPKLSRGPVTGNGDGVYGVIGELGVEWFKDRNKSKVYKSLLNKQGCHFYIGS